MNTSNGLHAALNVGHKVARRLGGLHKPWLRTVRRSVRLGEQWGYRVDEYRVLREIAAVARGHEPILVGPWLAEVGYEALYWVPFVRWFAHTYRVPAERLTVVSRGGVEPWYGGIAARYVELFDLFTPAEFAARNHARRTAVESGGQKHSALSNFDREIIAQVAGDRRASGVRVLHPALMFRLFGQFWLGNQAPDFLWRHTTHARVHVDQSANLGLPDRYTAVKLYTGRALPGTESVQQSLHRLVESVARVRPVVLLEAGFAADEHADHALARLSNVIRIGDRVTAATNLAVQTQVIAGAEQFVGTCGGLAWLAPLLGVPTVALYVDDRLLVTHLTVARHVYRSLDAASFSTLDLRALHELALAGPTA
jgi:hypothetical protein